MATINVSQVHEQKATVEADAGQVSKALVEWNNPEGNMLHRKILAQEELTERAKQGYDSAKVAVTTCQSEATESSQVFESTLDGAVALMKLHHLGEAPVLTDFYKADRYAFAEELISRLELQGLMGEWLAKSIHKAKHAVLGRVDKQREASAAFGAAGQGYQESVGRLKLLVMEAKLILRTSLPANAPVLRHLKRKKKEDSGSGAKTGEPQKPAA